MPGIEKLHLEDALNDSPQTRFLLGVFEQDARLLKRYTQSLHQLCLNVLSAQNELTTATQCLSQHLRAYERQNFPLETDDSILSSTLKQFANTLDEMSSWHQVLATQLADGMMFPLSRFLETDLGELTTMCEMFQITSQDHESALIKYNKLPKRKDNDKQRQDVNEEVYTMRKKFHQTALRYYSTMNALQYKHKTALIEPLLGFFHAQRSFFRMGQDSLSNSDIDIFLSNISASVQGVHAELDNETQKTVELVDSIIRQSQHLYYAEPPLDMPFIPPNTNMTHKAGYLFQKIKGPLMSRWERVFCFTQGGNLMSQGKGEMGGSLLLELDPAVMVSPLEQDDRRFLFHIIGGKKSVILQAENEREKDEWISTILNVVKDGGGYINEKSKKLKERSHSTPGALIKRKSSSTMDSGDMRSSGPPSSLRLSSIDTIISSTPIQFDMISPNDENKEFKPPKAGPPKRINPFDQTSIDLATAEAHAGTAAFSQVYVVRFLGSVEVKTDRGEQLLYDTIRHIMAARAIHNIFKMAESHMVVSSESLKLIDPATQATRTEFALDDISFWAAHKENNRLLAFITRTRGGKIDGSSKFACHVFESNTSGEEICNSLVTATKIAFQSLMERKTDKTKELDTDNIDDLSVHDNNKYNNSKLADCVEPDLDPPFTQNQGDGDERKVEGAESEY